MNRGLGFDAQAAVWPERDDWSAEFVRLLASAQEGGSTIAECYLAAGRIGAGSDDAWHREWMRLADASNRRGDAAHLSGNRLTAQSNWLRAVNYYLAAAFPFEGADVRLQASVAGMRKCARKWLDSEGAETVAFPWLRDYPLQGYLLRPHGARDPLPAVICIGEPGHRKEEHLFKLARYARERGLVLLTMDIQGEESDGRLAKVAGHPFLESAVSCAVDYLLERKDVDARRIAVLADGWGSSFVARGVATEPRIAAAVCDGGLWDLHERAFLASRHATENMARRHIARNIECPVLITVGARGWLQADRVSRMVDQWKGEGRDVVLRVFTAEETAAVQGHADNPTLANEYIFDWLAARLGPQARPGVVRALKLRSRVQS